MFSNSLIYSLAIVNSCPAEGKSGLVSWNDKAWQSISSPILITVSGLYCFLFL